MMGLATMTAQSSKGKGKRNQASAQKGEIKRGKGRPQLYGDQKKEGHEIGITPDGWAGIMRMAKERGISASELIERIGRGDIALAPLSETDESDSLAIAENDSSPTTSPDATPQPTASNPDRQLDPANQTDEPTDDGKKRTRRNVATKQAAANSETI